MFSLRKSDILAIVLATLFCLVLAPASWARTMLDHQPLVEQCKYKGNVTGFIVNAYQAAKAEGAPMPNITVNFLADASDGERALVQTYIDRAAIIALTTTMTPKDIAEATYIECMGGEEADASLLKVGTQYAGVEQHLLVLDQPDPVVKDLHYYKMEWCYMIGVDARAIIKHIDQNGITAVDVMHHKVEATPYFSPNKRNAVHALLESARLAHANKVPPGDWFKSVTHSCMEE